MTKMRRRSGQATFEFALLYTGVILPLTFMTYFTAEALWIWHSVSDLTRDGARYAATHCWMADGSNVVSWIQQHAPRMVAQNQFRTNTVGITVEYFSVDPATGAQTPFTCDGDCSAGCRPDTVSVSIANFRFTGLATLFRLAPIQMPDFKTTIPMESAGCDETGNCLP
jgi:hypothetical protein